MGNILRKLRYQTKLPMKVIKVVLIIFFSWACNTSPQIQTNELKAQKPKNVILMIGDGMGLSQVSSAFYYQKDSTNFWRFPVIGLSRTSSASHKITDSAAGATAFSIGKKTYNGAIGVNADTIPERTILEYAEDAGMATGLVATSAITHATPASFIAHQPSRQMQEEIASDFLKTDIDVFIGGGKQFFTDRKDGANLADSLTAKGYRVFFDTTGINEVHNGRVAALLAPDEMPPYAQGRGEMLMPSAMKAIEILSQNQAGFFLMIEGSQIDWGGHVNNAEYLISEEIDFDHTIGAVLDYAKQHPETLVIVTADHETGGFTLAADHADKMKGDYNTIAPSFSTTGHSTTLVPVFAIGPGSEAFSGVYENTAIFDKMMKALGLTYDKVR